MDADAIFSGPAVTLEQVLEARTQRAERQRAALADGAQTDARAGRFLRKRAGK